MTKFTHPYTNETIFLYFNLETLRYKLVTDNGVTNHFTLESAFKKVCIYWNWDLSVSSAKPIESDKPIEPDNIETVFPLINNVSISIQKFAIDGKYFPVYYSVENNIHYMIVNFNKIILEAKTFLELISLYNKFVKNNYHGIMKPHWDKE